MNRLDCVVVGAGVVGLAVARALALDGREVVVLEAGGQILVGASSRNSGVIHAGLYYPPGSAKARLCLRGRALMYEYLEARRLSHRRTGKLVVASRPDQLDRLQELAANARQCGATEIEWLDAVAVRKLEPELQAEAALLSPVTGIVDVHDYGLSLVADIEAAGGVVLLHSAVSQLVFSDGIHFRLGDADYQCRTLINAAGLGAIRLLDGSDGIGPGCLPRQYFAKGHYFSLRGDAPFSHLVYPLPASGTLGIHFGLDLAGQGRFGPDIFWQDDDSLVFEPGRKAAFVESIKAYWPSLDADRLQPDFVGVRSKIHGADETMADFILQGPGEHGIPGLINLLGIESPGLTCSLAIGEAVSEMLTA